MMTRARVMERLASANLSEERLALVDGLCQPSNETLGQEIGQIINEWMDAQPNPAVAFKRFCDMFEFTEDDYETARDRFIIEAMTRSGVGIVGFTSLDTSRMMVILWLMEASRRYGDCKPEAKLIVYLLGEYGTVIPSNNVQSNARNARNDARGVRPKKKWYQKIFS